MTNDERRTTNDERSTPIARQFHFWKRTEDFRPWSLVFRHRGIYAQQRQPGLCRRIDDRAAGRGCALPGSDGMHVITVSGVPFNARCNYLARQVELNIDPILTRPALKHLAVHECYPGHYVQFKLRETWYR